MFTHPSYRSQALRLGSRLQLSEYREKGYFMSHTEQVAVLSGLSKM